MHFLCVAFVPANTFFRRKDDSKISKAIVEKPGLVALKTL